jgi:hypothetical protein
LCGGKQNIKYAIAHATGTMKDAFHGVLKEKISELILNLKTSV